MTVQIQINTPKTNQPTVDVLLDERDTRSWRERASEIGDALRDLGATITRLTETAKIGGKP